MKLLLTIFIILLFGAIIPISIWINKNGRYDFYIGIDWSSVPINNRKKLLSWVTTIIIIFSSISIFYLPLFLLNDAFYFLEYFSMYLGLGLLLALVIFGGYLKYSR